MLSIDLLVIMNTKNIELCCLSSPILFLSFPTSPNKYIKKSPFINPSPNSILSYVATIPRRVHLPHYLFLTPLASPSSFSTITSHLLLLDHFVMLLDLICHTLFVLLF
mmetsp:Transcript_45924/g.69268  ORF Transcript_45924/g.69268 Transcript_45924/m.69268 type:complete len:108 (+) Transcript_45924:217-540(+)